MGGGKTQNQTSINVFALRRVTVSKILNLKKKNEGLTRQCQFLAVSIVDKFYACKDWLKQNETMSNEQSSLIAAASLSLACKLEGLPGFNFQKTIVWFFQKQLKQFYLEKICEMEAIILDTIDYACTFETSFTVLRSVLKEKKLKNGDTNRAKTLKILMLSLQESSILSEKPEIAAEIYDLVESGKGSKQAKKIYHSISTHQKKISPRVQT